MKRIRISEPQLDDKEKKILKEVIDTKIIASGKYVARFEEEFSKYLNCKYSVATSSGTTALHAALIAAGIKKDDIVLTTPFSFIATANCILFVGAKPEFVDINENSFNLDIDLLEKRLSSRMKKPAALIVVHLYGNPMDMPRVKKLCNKYKIKLIEDCAQSHGAEVNGKVIGTFGLAGCFSFYATKNMTTGEGGMITTNNKKYFELSKKIINHGRVGRFHHDILGYNFRITNLQAGIGLVQMTKIRKMTELRIKNAKYLSRNLTGIDWITIPKVQLGTKHVFHQYTIRVPKKIRKKFVNYLISNGIDAATIYPLTIPEQPLYKRLGYSTKGLEKSVLISREVVSLPVHPGLTRKDLEKVINTIRRFK
ncbi:DegT/DnrJ/EryC1/StrS family aminotransferase [Candidatus Dependentiae bacterium]|nr:DegT/DnrJ/EryC1/StrS family aminotransferase [Candidatus Dependentiae bacterium]